MQVAVLNGVNLSMLGKRDPAQYGTTTLSQLETMIYGWAQDLKLTVRCWQTNSEGDYVDMIHEACSGADGLIVNPGAWTHYSYAVRDALEIFPGPIVEVHLSNVQAREQWRRHSIIGEAARASVQGLGWRSYTAAFRALVEQLRED